MSLISISSLKEQANDVPLIASLSRKRRKSLISISTFIAQVAAIHGACAAGLAFEAPVELTQATELSEFVMIDADGNGIQDAVGYDPARQELAACLRSHNHAEGETRLALGRTESEDVQVFSMDVDGDGVVDMLVRDGGWLKWWRHIPNTGMEGMGRLFELGQNRFLLDVGDYDGDGYVDLVFSEFDDDSTNRQFYDIGVAWGKVVGFDVRLLGIIDEPLAYYSPSVDWGDVDGNGSREMLVSLGVGLVFFDGRDVARVVRPDAGNLPGSLADMVGDAAAEGVTIHTKPDFGLISREEFLRLVVSRWDGAAFREIARLTVDELITYALPAGSYFRAVIAQPQAGGKDEVVFLSSEGFARIYRMNAETLVYQAAVYPIFPLEGLQSVMARDLDGDGGDELLSFHRPTETNTFGFSTTSGPMKTALTDISLKSGFRERRANLSLSIYFDPIKLASLRTAAGASRLAMLGGDRIARVWEELSDDPLMQWKLFNASGHRDLMGCDFGKSEGDEELVLLTGAGVRGGVYDGLPLAQTLQAGILYREPDHRGVRAMKERDVGGAFRASLIGSGDMNGDGTKDLVYLRAGDGAMVWAAVRPNHPGGRDEFGAEVSMGIAPFVQYGYMGPMAGSLTKENVIIRDVDGDGCCEILTYPSIYGKRIALLRNDGAGNLAGIEPFGNEISGNPIMLVEAQVIGGGEREILSVSSDWQSQATVRTHNSMTGAIQRESKPNIVAGTFKFGDMDGDGLDDMLMLEQDVYGNVHFIRLARCLGTDGFSEGIMLKSGLAAFEPGLVELADFDGDGRADIVVADKYYGRVVFMKSVALPSYPTYLQWAAGNGLNGGMRLDSDGDGLINLEEYYAGTNPRVFDAEASGYPGDAPELLISDDPTIFGLDLHLEASRAIRQTPGLGTAKLSIVVSHNMVNWEDWVIQPEVSLIAGYPGWVFWKWWPRRWYAEESGNPKGFARFKFWTE